MVRPLACTRTVVWQAFVLHEKSRSQCNYTVVREVKVPSELSSLRSTSRSSCSLPTTACSRLTEQQG